MPIRKLNMKAMGLVLLPSDSSFLGPIFSGESPACIDHCINAHRNHFGCIV